MDLLLDARNTLGEGILWNERSGRLFWTDIEASMLWSCDADGGALRRWPLPERLCSMAMTARDERLLLGLASGLALFDLGDGRLERLHAVEAGLPGTRINDGRVDRQGRFVFGMFNQAEDPKHPIGGFYRLNRDFSLERLPLGGAAIANSICFSPDGATMYYADSATGEIRCCDYASDSSSGSGAVSKLRTFAAADAAPGGPDGSTVDAEGHVWNTRWGAGLVVRFAPDGSVERTVALAAPQPTCPAFGGPALDTLFLTSATVGLADAALAQAPGSGGVFAGKPGVRGLPEARFGVLTDA